MTECKLTPFGVIQKYAEDEGLAWSATHADAILDRLKREGYQLVDGPRATDELCSRVPVTMLKHHDRIVTGLHGQWLGDIIGTHETVDGEEAMIVMVVPTDSVFEVAGTTPTRPTPAAGHRANCPKRDVELGGRPCFYCSTGTS